MSIDDHRNPGGTYDGIGAMAEFTRLPRSEVEAIAAQVKANHEKLKGCPWHEFEALITAPPGGGRYRCRHCQGEVESSAYYWHQQGRRPMPVGEPQPVRKVCVGYPCEGGPLDGQMLAYDDDCTYRVNRLGRPPAIASLACVPPVDCAEYRLTPRGEALVWVFQGWPA